MRRVHLGDDEGHIGRHAVVLRVREHHLARPRERRLRIAGDRRVERGKDDVGRDLRGVACQNFHAGDAHRHVVGADPLRRLGVRLAGRPLGCRDFDQLEPRMVDEQTDERLPNGAGGAEHGDTAPAFAARFAWCHELRSVRTIRSYAPTAARSSSTSMNSSGVWAT